VIRCDDIDAIPSSRAYVPLGQRSDGARAAHTRTDAQGTFRLALDPGRYDVAVKPPEGSRFPWLVRVAREIGAADASLDACVIPPPVPLTTTLLVGDGNLNVPLANAVVRAFAVPDGGRAWVEIGRRITNRAGKLELYLAKPTL